MPSLTDDQALEALELSAFKNMKNDPKANYTWMSNVC